jgi:hypothetical protein
LENVRPLLQNGTHMSSSMYNKSFFPWIIFGTWYMVTCLFFDPLPPLKRWGRCWLVGPTCQPLWTINISFLGFIFDRWFLGTLLFLSIPCRLC